METKAKRINMATEDWAVYYGRWYVCPHCGKHRVFEGYKYCPDCGGKVIWTK